MAHSAEPALSKTQIVSHVYPLALAMYLSACGPVPISSWLSIHAHMAVYPCGHVSMCTWLLIHMQNSFMCYLSVQSLVMDYWPMGRVWFCVLGQCTGSALCAGAHAY
jgi:hypothetical protein